MNLVDIVRKVEWGRGGAAVLIVAVAVFVGLIANRLVFVALGRVAGMTKNRFDDLVVRYCRRPGSLLFPTLLLSFVAPSLRLSADEGALYKHGLSILSIAAGTYLARNLAALARDALIEQVGSSGESPLSSRKIVTQVRMAEKVLLFIIFLCSFAFVLMTFESIRQVGVSILASAGVAGVIVGLAAQRSIGTLLAGIQIAIAQPIRIDDLVVVEGECGTIEEISLTYVVVRIWDLRRLVVPITYFMDKPFQNWTRSSTELLGTVFLYADYGIPVDAVRAELERVAKESSLWDGKVCKVQVTDAKENVLELRCCVSAANSSDLWDLRCVVREKLVSFVEANHSKSLPRVRAEIDRMSAIVPATPRPDPSGVSRETTGIAVIP